MYRVTLPTMTSLHRTVGVAVLGILLAGPSLSLAQSKADAPPANVDPKKIEQAKKHMAAGAALYDDPSGHKCEEAYVEFNKAFELSGSLNALKNRAVCALELEKDGEALTDFKKVLAGLGDKLAPDEKAQIEKDVKTLESATAWVTIKVDVPKAKLTDVRTPSRNLPVTNRYEVNGTLKLGIHPGEHAFTIASEDGKELTWKVSVGNGSTLEHTFEITKIPVAPAVTAVPTVTGPAPTVTTAPTEAPMIRPTPTSVKVMVGVTGAFLVGAGVMMGLASVAKSDFDKINGTGAAEADVKNKRDTVILMNGIADGLLGATVLSAGTTLVLYLIRPSVKAEEAQKSGFYLTPAVSPAAGGLVAGGRF